MRRGGLVIAVLAMAAAAALLAALTPTLVAERGQAPTQAATPVSATPPTIRLSGTVEATRAGALTVPRLAGQNINTLVITRLAPPGRRVEAGDVLVEFDPQIQQKFALDRRAEVVDLDNQIKRRIADQATTLARDETERAQAEHDVQRARMNTLNNAMIARVEADKNNLALEQAIARLKQLTSTFALKRTAAEADLKILQIRRGRTERAMLHAEDNARLMVMRAPFGGLIVLRSIFKSSTMAEVQEGDEVRPGQPILDVVDPTSMRVRAQVNQADIGLILPGQAAKIRLDAYPQLTFDGRVETIAPLGTQSEFSQQLRMFVVVVSIRGTDPQLMPDLTASVDVVVPVKGSR